MAKSALTRPWAENICIEAADHSVTRVDAAEFFGLTQVRDPAAQAARFVSQFAQQNRALLHHCGARIECEYQGRDVAIALHTSSTIGALPLLSPTSARPDYGLVIQPRFPWSGIGPMLMETGLKVTPTPLRFPMLRRSERRVPPWVLSSMVLARIDALLKTISPHFEFTTAIHSAPKGQVDWPSYATRSLPRAAWLEVPCRYPDFGRDRALLGAIRFCLEKQIRSLDTQRAAGSFVHRLLALATSLLDPLRDIPALAPAPGAMHSWLQRPFRSTAFVEGLEGMNWTLDERGLAGLSDLEGIPWQMSMEDFFEAWVETIAQLIAQQTGGKLTTARSRATVRPICWQPPFLGSQRSLVPDFVLDYPTRTIILDAKYKRHWEQLQDHRWDSLADTVRDEHRHDLLQILAYGNLTDKHEVILCLIYPCHPGRWQSLAARNDLFHEAELSTGHRRLRLWLTAVPMSFDRQRAAAPLLEQVRSLDL